jgi:hypothetical protein
LALFTAQGHGKKAILGKDLFVFHGLQAAVAIQNGPPLARPFLYD